MKRILGLLLILTMAVLVACGNADTGTEDTSQSETTTDNTSTSDANFTATISGAVEAEIADDGFYQCETVNGGELTVFANFGMEDNIILSLPRDIQPGSYDITVLNTEPDNIGAEYIGESFIDQSFDENVSGTLELIAVAGASGEQIAGNFEFTAENDDAEMVTVTGSFDFEASNAAFANC